MRASRGSSRACRPTATARPPACLPSPSRITFAFLPTPPLSVPLRTGKPSKGAFSLSLPPSLSLPSLLSSFPCSSSWWLNSDRRPSARPSALRPSDHRLRGASDGRRPPLSPRLRRRPRRPRVHFLGNTAASNWDSKRRKKRLVFRLFFSFGLNLSCLPLSLFRAPPNQEEETNTRPPT